MKLKVEKLFNKQNYLKAKLNKMAKKFLFGCFLAIFTFLIPVPPNKSESQVDKNVYMHNKVKSIDSKDSSVILDSLERQIDSIKKRICKYNDTTNKNNKIIKNEYSKKDTTKNLEIH